MARKNEPDIRAWCNAHDADLWREHPWVVRAQIAQTADLEGEVRDQLQVWLREVSEAEEEAAEALRFPGPPRPADLEGVQVIEGADIDVGDGGPNGMCLGAPRVGFWQAHPRMKYAIVVVDPDWWGAKLWLDKAKAN